MSDSPSISPFQELILSTDYYTISFKDTRTTRLLGQYLSAQITEAKFAQFMRFSLLTAFKRSFRCTLASTFSPLAGVTQSSLFLLDGHFSSHRFSVLSVCLIISPWGESIIDYVFSPIVAFIDQLFFAFRIYTLTKGRRSPVQLYVFRGIIVFIICVGTWRLMLHISGLLIDSTGRYCAGAWCIHRKC